MAGLGINLALLGGLVAVLGGVGRNDPVGVGIGIALAGVGLLLWELIVTVAEQRLSAGSAFVGEP